MKLEVNVKDVVKKVVGAGNNAGRIYVPQRWVGKEVVCALLDDNEIENDDGGKTIMR